MKANEIMIGDWIYNKHHKKNIQITPYDFFTHGHLPSGNQYFIGEPELVSGRDLEPIPLTPEILEKNGFTKDSEKFDETHYWFTLIDGHTKFSLLYARSVFQWLGPLDFKYVHELQHALRLSGIEKEIEL